MKYIRVTNQSEFTFWQNGDPYKFYIFAFETKKQCVEFAEKHFNKYEIIPALQAKKYFKNSYGICQNCGQMTAEFETTCFCDYLENLEWDKNNKETF